MNDSEAQQARQRLAQYNKLNDLREKIDFALRQVTEDWANGPHGQGPFTGNCRESRHVKSVQIQFSETRGGAEATNIDIHNLFIEAYDLGNALKVLLKAKLATIAAEMEKI